MKEWDKMKSGEWYDSNWPDILQARMKAQDLCFELNQYKPSLQEKRVEILTELLGYYPEGLFLLSPFMCDYGVNIKMGKNVFVNTNCYFMDCADIVIGDNVFIGPFCGFYTDNHPMDFASRNTGLERAQTITVGDNCWFGANVSVMPGVTIGSGCVIAAGSVVTQDIPDNSMAAGVPAKVMKKIEQR